MMLAALLWVAMSALPAHAQGAATINGRITDPQGLVVPGVEVRAVNINTNVTYATKSNDVGLYSIPNVPVGTYRVIVEKQGFTQIVKPDVQLHVQDIAELNFSLQVGSVTQSVTVEGGAPLVSLSPSVSTVVDRQFVGNLPLNGRSFQSLILLTPGVTVAATNYGDYGQFSVNGQRASTNYLTVDGVSANIGILSTNGGGANVALTGAYPGLSVFGGTNSLVSQDALEEFKIQTSSYAAEFGRQAGGQISLVTRSGSNQFHGTLFEYFRNDALDATDWFTNASGLKKPALRQNDFGGTFSGPIRRDKTFFFASYEGQRLRLPVSGSTVVPSLRVRSAAAAGVRPVLNAFPLPTGAEILNTAGLPSGWAPSTYSLSGPGRMDAYSIRVDHIVSSKLTLFGRFNESPSNATTFYSFQGGAFGNRYNEATRTVTLGATSALSSRLSNEFRFNYSRQLGQREYVPNTYGGGVPVDPALLTNGYDGLGAVTFILGSYSAGVDVGYLTKNYQKQINFVDNVSLVKGVHQFKFGVDYRRISPTYGPQNQQIVYFYSEASVNNGIADYAYPYTYLSAHPRYNNYSFYGQDTWKVTPRLTLDYGLRWELNPAPTVPSGEQMPAMAVGITGNPPNLSSATLAPAGTPFYKTFYKAFAPRGGVAYQLNSTKGRETVLRGGFGVYYDLGSSGATEGFPLVKYNSLSGVPFPLSAANAARPTVTVPTSLPVTSTVYSDAQDLKLPHTLQWNVSVEQSLGTQQSVSVSYVGSAARQLLTMQQMNYAVNGVKPNPNFASIYYVWNGPTSDYHSMQVQYKARLKRDLQALVNYTWSHAIDEVSTDIGTLVLARGNSDFDVRHNLSAALAYNLPTPNGAEVLKQLLGHWSVDAIVHAQSGFPVNVYSTSTVTPDGQMVYVRPNYVLGQPLYIYDSIVPGGRRFNSAAFTSPASGQQGNFGRNVFRGLPLWQADMALGRSFNFTEKWKLQFKGELFNIFNHPLFGTYGYNFTTPKTFGVPTTMLRNNLSSSTAASGLSSLYQMGGPRSIQFSLKLTF
jgi:hypothetical protein